LHIRRAQERTTISKVQLADAVKNDASTGFLQQRYLIAAVRERCAQA
jgi:hypothetical protein